MSLYDVLGVHPSATLAEIRTSYKRRALEVHPDKGGSAFAFQRVISAFEQLADPAKRAAYDRTSGGKVSKRKRFASAQAVGTSKKHSARKKKEENVAQQCGGTANPDANACKLGKNNTVSLTTTPAKFEPSMSRKTEDSHLHVSTSHQRLMSRIVTLMRRLDRADRCEFIKSQLNQMQRSELEKLMVAHRPNKADPTQKLTLARKDSVKSDDDDATSSLSSDEDAAMSGNWTERLAICDAELPQARTLEHVAQRVPRVRGISTASVRCKTKYSAHAAVEWMNFRTEYRASLADTIDLHVVLIAITERIRNTHGLLEDRLKSALQTVPQEHGVECIGMGLYIRIEVPTTHWTGQNLHSPNYRICDLDALLQAWQSFRQARGERTIGGRGLVYRSTPQESEETWLRIRAAYVAVWEKRGKSQEQSVELLDALFLRRASFREETWRRWNVWKMQREEQLQRDAIRVQEQLARRDHLTEMRERRLMWREEQLTRKLAKGMQRAMARQLKLERCMLKLKVLVSQWTRRVSRETELHARAAARTARRHETKQRLLARKLQKTDAARRWKWLRNPDRTVDEMLRGW